MYNLRYHIASLVAVFLALALGLVLGGLVVQQGTFSKQQKSLVSGLQRDFRKLSSENTRLRKESKLQSDFSGQMTAAWAEKRLDGHSVVVLTSGAEKEGAAHAVAAIKQAGGRPIVVTILSREFGINNPKVADAVRSIVPTSAELRVGLAKGLASEWATATASRPITDALVKAGAIKVTGLKASVAAADLVDVASFLQKPDEVAIDVCRAYADEGLYAIGAQTPTGATGVAPAAIARGLSAFDTLGTPPGQFTLVALLSGGEQGYFGLNANVSKPFPAMP